MRAGRAARRSIELGKARAGSHARRGEAAPYTSLPCCGMTLACGRVCGDAQISERLIVLKMVCILNHCINTIISLSCDIVCRENWFRYCRRDPLWPCTILSLGSEARTRVIGHLHCRVESEECNDELATGDPRLSGHDCPGEEAQGPLRCAPQVGQRHAIARHVRMSVCGVHAHAPYLMVHIEPDLIPSLHSAGDGMVRIAPLQPPPSITLLGPPSQR